MKSIRLREGKDRSRERAQYAQWWATSEALAYYSYLKD